MSTRATSRPTEAPDGERDPGEIPLTVGSVGRDLRSSMISGFAATLGSQLVALIASVSVLLALIAFVPIQSYARYTAVLGVSSLMGAFVVSPLMALVVEDVTRDREHAERTLAMAWGGLLIGWLGVLIGTMALVWLLLPDAALAMAFVVVVGDFAIALVQIVASHDQVALSLERAARVRVTAQLLRAAVLVIALVLTHDLILSLGGTALAMLAVGWWVASPYRGAIVAPLRPSRSFISRGAYYLMGDSSGQLQEDFDKTVLERYHPGVTTAVYALSFRLFQIAALPILALAGSFQSRLVQRVDDVDAFQRQLHRLTRFAFAYAIAAYGGLVALAFLATSLFNTRFGTDPALIMLLGLTLPVRALVPFGQTALIAVERRGTRVVARVAGALASTGLYFWLIPAHGWRGAVIGTVASELVVAGITWFGIMTAVRSIRTARITTSPSTGRST